MRKLVVLGKETAIFGILLEHLGAPPLHVGESLPSCLELIGPACAEEDIRLELLVPNDAEERRLNHLVYESREDEEEYVEGICKQGRR